jgi:hypothetical protein
MLVVRLTFNRCPDRLTEGCALYTVIGAILTSFAQRIAFRSVFFAHFSTPPSSSPSICGSSAVAQPSKSAYGSLSKCCVHVP